MATPATVDLNQLKEEITTIGNKIKELKSSGGSKDEITKTVQELLQKKQLYADNNSGIGVDGKPFKANMTKAEKKKQNAAAASGGGGGGGGQQPQVRKEERRRKNM